MNCELFYDYLQRQEERRLQRQEQYENEKMLHNLVTSLFRLGHISSEEYEKWALSPTGRYLPKVITK